MFYIDSYGDKTHTYNVGDTEDGSIEVMTLAELKEAQALGVVIYGAEDIDNIVPFCLDKSLQSKISLLSKVSVIINNDKLVYGLIPSDVKQFWPGAYCSEICTDALITEGGTPIIYIDDRLKRLHPRFLDRETFSAVIDITGLDDSLVPLVLYYCNTYNVKVVTADIPTITDLENFKTISNGLGTVESLTQRCDDWLMFYCKSAWLNCIDSRTTRVVSASIEKALLRWNNEHIADDLIHYLGVNLFDGRHIGDAIVSYLISKGRDKDIKEAFKQRFIWLMSLVKGNR